MNNEVLKINTSNLESITEAKIHSIPFRISADVDTKVDQYFNSSRTKDENGNAEASFRGYPLKGKSIKLPTDYKGIIFEKSICFDDNKSIYPFKQFQELMYWNWDKTVSKNDSFIQCLDWIDVAEELHAPITSLDD